MSTKTKSLWIDAFERLIRDRWALISLVVVLIYGIVALCATFGIFVPDWNNPVGSEYLAPNSTQWLGTDLFGRDVLAKVIHGTKVAMSVGLITSLIAGCILYCVSKVPLMLSSI